ncbi:LysM peptidoglycan-binding domain-containing protein [Bacillus sp. RG28]|uniref:LysM peptidoglycan-binding domain-containing protein n=1 Tax=Gottfriedia endophytica TaxID=2820819 RepID=A0A940NRH9_9BACI|nr:LysM peptidoglycan-binding domain-containing protein [Gottfriedia endophytica]MBP0725531.1 LysM peptidoglycan-binding domain-containing protein [Gottfriedia endophytica]
MKWWLIGNQGKEKFQLPVPPGDFKLNNSHDIQTVNLNEIGDFPIKADRKPISISITSILPSQDYYFCQYRPVPKPYDCVSKIEKWKESNYPIQLLVTETNINRLFLIESFEYGERAGSRDVEFTLNLIEFRYITKPSNVSSSTTKKRNSQPRKTSKSYTVKSGDTLFVIARKVYGDGSKWRSLASKNNIKDPKNLKAGKVLML